jgi:hypothetical protein
MSVETANGMVEPIEVTGPLDETVNIPTPNTAPAPPVVPPSAEGNPNDEGAESTEQDEGEEPSNSDGNESE